MVRVSTPAKTKHASTHFDIDQVKVSAVNCWPTILSQLGGIPPASLTGQHSPCYKCGGTDRFRMVDPVAGAIYCNQCLRNCGDGFAALQWATGRPFKECLRMVAEYLGIGPTANGSSSSGNRNGTIAKPIQSNATNGQSPANRNQVADRPAADPAANLAFKPWHDLLGQIFCVANNIGGEPTWTADAVQHCGGQRAVYRRDNTVVAFAVWGPQLTAGKAIGYFLMPIAKAPLPKWVNKQRSWIRRKLTAGSKAGLIGPVERLATATTVWLVEGVSDLLAFSSLDLPPGVVAVSPSCGCGQKPLAWIVKLLAGKMVFVIFDSDSPGQTGATRWVQALRAAGIAAAAKQLPFDVVPDHGKDTRDFKAEQPNCSYQDFESLLNIDVVAEACEADQQADQTADEDEEEEGSPYADDGKPKTEQDVTVFAKVIVEAIGLDVLGHQGNKIKVFSHSKRRTVLIDRISQWAYEDILVACGPVAQLRVVRKADENTPLGVYSVQEVREAVAVLAASCVIDDGTELGVGVWDASPKVQSQGGQLDAAEATAASLVLVNAGEAALFTPGRPLEKVTHPRCQDRLLDFESSTRQWYNFDELSSLLQKCDADFSQAVVNELVAILSRWRWPTESAPWLIAGLILATWVQSVWEWRPQVAITGASKAGKTRLFKMVASLFGDLCQLSSKSTAAGIRQAIRSTSVVTLADEFEQSSHRKEILEMIRASGRGDAILRGTASQKVQHFNLRHIFWLAAVEVGLKREPDRNRFIGAELLKPKEQNRGKLAVPSKAELAALGQRLLAVAITHVDRAKALAASLRDAMVDGIDDRVIESYSVPVAMLAAIDGRDEVGTQEMLKIMLAGASQEDTSAGSSDEAALMEAILGAHIHSRGSSYSVSQLLATVMRQGTVPATEPEVDALEKSGLKFDSYGESKEVKNKFKNQEDKYAGKKCLAIAINAAPRHLLRGTEWENQQIEKILLRIEDTIVARRPIAGRVNAVLISEAVLRRDFLDEAKDEDKDEGESKAKASKGDDDVPF